MPALPAYLFLDVVPVDLSALWAFCVVQLYAASFVAQHFPLVSPDGVLFIFTAPLVFFPMRASQERLEREAQSAAERKAAAAKLGAAVEGAKAAVWGTVGGVSTGAIKTLMISRRLQPARIRDAIVCKGDAHQNRAGY